MTSHEERIQSGSSSHLEAIASTQGMSGMTMILASGIHMTATSPIIVKLPRGTVSFFATGSAPWNCPDMQN